MLEAVNISHTFHRSSPFSRQVLDGISLNLASGETVLLTGPSGSGKTTLARVLAGLIQPEMGTVRLNGSDLHTTVSKRLPTPKLVVLTSQYPERQFFANTVWEELSWGLRVGLGMGVAEVRQRVNMIAADLAFPLPELADRPPRSLSSGQQRKAALVSMLALKPQVLILDEPLAGLNARERSRLLELLRQWPDKNRTMLVVAHELELFLGWVQRVAVMGSGRFVFLGSPSELCQTSENAVREAIALPPLGELSYHLKQSGMSEGPVSIDSTIVRKQLKKALAQLGDSLA